MTPSIIVLALLAAAPGPAAAPAPKLVPLDSAGKDYVRLLAGPPETVTMKAGLVVLAPTKNVGKHSTEAYEELVIVLEGKGEMRLTGGGVLRLTGGTAAYCPPRTEHDVFDTGAGPLRYVYVVARAVPAAGAP